MVDNDLFIQAYFQVILTPGHFLDFIFLAVFEVFGFFTLVLYRKSAVNSG